MIRSRVLALAVSLGLSACAQLSPLPEEIPIRAQSIETFQLDGRISVRNAGDSMSAHMQWVHGPVSDEIVLNTPLGSGLARIVSGPNGAVLETSDQKRVEADNAEDLSERVFGFRLPISQLSRWIVARPAKGQILSVDESGRPKQIADGEWRIDYERYENDKEGALPLLVQLEGRNVNVRVRVDSWSLP